MTDGYGDIGMWVNFYFLLTIFGGQLDGIKLSDILVSVSFAILATLAYFIFGKAKSQQRSIRYLILVFWTVLYFEITLLITIFRREPGTLYHSGKIVPYFQWGNLNGDYYAKRQCVFNFLNVLLFIPIGCLLRALRIKTYGIKDNIMTALLGFLTSFCIEVVQLITKRGTFEITDIFTNFVGACLGVIITEIVKRILRYE